MLVPLSWLKDYVEVKIETKEYADAMTMSGSKVEGVEELGKGITGVVVGRIESILPHPNADKLVITQINIGEETLQVVTGAKNVKEGDYVPVAVAGATLGGGLKIKKGTLRGEVSEGMLCSQQELGIPDRLVPAEYKDGIWILDQPYPLGVPLETVVPYGDEIVEFEITSNRPDCLSVLGIARETAATLGTKVSYPQVGLEKETDETWGIQVEIDDQEGCSRYVVRVIKDIVIQPSPLWMQQRLMKAGVRPINNVVDITNYVMLEYGQPLHAFDLTTIAKRKIVVRKAADQELFRTLDGVERVLDPSMTVIADGEKALAVAGVMGGEDSEIKPDTKVVLLESANFNKDRVRATSKKLGLRTEASARFEKGVDANIALEAANRACQLLEQLGAGKVAAELVDAYPVVKQPGQASVRPERINQLLGTDLSPTDMIDILTSLEIEAKEAGDRLEIQIPTFRDDLQMEADFAEEIGRIYGFNRIPSTMMKGNVVVGGRTEKQQKEDGAKRHLTAMGFNEVLTYSFVSPKSVDKINLPADSSKRNFVRLLNPLGDETSVMRTTLLPNMMEVLTHNQHHRVEAARAFEMGSVFVVNPDPAEKLPQEITTLVLGVYGEEDFFSLKGAAEELLAQLGIREVSFQIEREESSYHPGRCATIWVQGEQVGVLGEIHPQVLENYDAHQKAYGAELNFGKILQWANIETVYRPLPKYPAIVRDFAMVVKEEVLVGQLEAILAQHKGELLESYALFDVYQGNQIQAGHKSIAYTLTYRRNDRTLTEEEVNQAHGEILKGLSRQLGGQLRE